MGLTITILISIAFLAFLSAAARKLTISGAIAGWLVASVIYLGAGITSLAMLGAFFSLAVAATALGRRLKERLGVDDHDKGKRDAMQVFANGGLAALTALMVMFDVSHESSKYLILIGAALSSATADTLSSELGTVYGKRFINVLSFKKDIRGENGVVSWEGTLAGLAGSCVIAGIFLLGCKQQCLRSFAIIMIAGTIGNIADSILGATLERKGIIGNNAVNFLNTLTAVLFAWLLNSVI